MSAFDPDQAEEYFEFTKKIKLMQAEINRATFKANANIENSLKQQRRLQMVMTRSVGGGGVLGSAFNMLQTVGGVKQQQFQDKKRRMDELKEKGIGMNQIEVQELRGLQGKKSGMERLDDTFEKYFGGDSKWNKMFGGHGKMAAAGLGMGAVGGGMALTKAIIDSSAMLQQMLKLLQFGVMLVLKPIGDFFGFLMRPIMILLLRKFIIPFYQKVYPWFATTGAKIGTDIAKVMDALTTEGAIVVAIGAVTAALGGTLAIKDWLDDKKMTKLANKIGARIQAGTDLIDDSKPTTNTGKQTKINNSKFTGGTTTEGGKFMGRDDPMKNKTLSKYSSNPAIKKVQKFMDRINDIKLRRPDIPQSQIQSQITEFMDKQKGGGANGVIDKLKRVLTSSKFLNKIGGTLAKGGFWGLAHELMLDMFNIDIVDGNYDPTTDPKNMMAKGGIINEPIKGIGQRTGQSYLLGEAGSEAVIPMSKMGGMGGTTTVNISIGNMSGNANDLNKLRSTILEVMQTVNVNRGR